MLRPNRLLFIFIILLFFSSQAFTEKYALLVGVSDYPTNPLEGPVNDANSIYDILASDLGFKRENIIILTNSRATKKGILEELSSLESRTKAGDIVFIYFSGHGTSSLDYRLNTNIGTRTGALIPYDFNPSSKSDIRKGLVIGREHIKPILKKLDRDRKVFVVFDACYSGFTVRALSEKGKPKYMPISLGEEDKLSADNPISNAIGADKQEDDRYPYNNVIYISASSDKETAIDINKSYIESNKNATFDGKPHGALTNYLVRGLKGEADTDHNSVITYREMGDYLRATVKNTFGHTPQLLFDEENTKALYMAVLDTSQRIYHYPPIEPYKDLKVKIEDSADIVLNSISGVKGIEIVDSDYDLFLRKSREEKYEIILSNETVLFSSAVLDEVVSRIKRQAEIKELVRLSNPDQRFNVRVELIGEGISGILFNGDKVGFRISTEAQAHLLLLSIDTTGYVSVLLPSSIAKSKLHAGESLSIPALGRVTPPLGTEYIKVIAFPKKPEFFDELYEKELNPTDAAFKKLLENIKMEKDYSQMTIQVTTCEKSDFK